MIPTPPERRTVWVDVALPQAVDRELEARDLSPRRNGTGAECLTEAAQSDAKAVICNVPGASQPQEIDSIFAAAKGPLDNGALVIMVPENEDVQARLLTRLEHHYPVKKRGLDNRFSPEITRIVAEETAQLAQLCARFPAERADTELQIEIVGDYPVLPEDMTLLRRAFNDFHRAEVECVYTRGAGVESSNIYRVRIFDDDIAGAVTFVLKSMPFNKSDPEKGIYEHFIPKNTPFANVPPLALDRCISTSCRSSIVTQFVDRAVLFKDFIQTNSPALAVAALFDGPLRCWRSRSRRDEVKIAAIALGPIVNPNANAYDGVYQSAINAGLDVRTPQELIDALKSKPAMEVGICFSHGDLHDRNIFVRDGSNEIVLIDLNRAGFHPMSRDPAELDAALAFSGLGPGERVPQSVVDLYEGDLLAPAVLCRTEGPRTLAIEQIRRQIVGSVSEGEYRLMLACHCLYWAKKGLVDAYNAAHRLI